MKRIENFSADHPSLHLRVFKEIEQAILNGTFAPGDSLVETRLSAELGVSRTPVREALRQLELEGLVYSVPNKGFVVIGISEKDINDIYTIRMAIEGLAARWAAEHITDDEIDRLREVVELQEFYAGRDDVLQVWHLDSRFHEQIYQYSRSAPLKYMLSNFHNYIQHAREISFKSQGRADIAVGEHRAIFEAIANHQADCAEKLTAEHIKNAKKNLFR